jgi:hypothetical protein
MKREFSTLYLENQRDGYQPGDEAAHRAAAALADRADAPTVAALTDALALLERVGGQVHVTALRIEPDDGSWQTAGLGFSYETKDAHLKVAAAPEEVFGVPVTDISGPPVELPEPAEPEAEAEPDAQPDAEEPVALAD